MSDDHAPTWFRADLLLELADILECADAEHLARGEPTYRQNAWTHPCGTPAGALGHWAAAHPERGWRFDLDDPIFGGRVYQGYKQARSAAESEFGLTRTEAELLFGLYGCGFARSSREVAEYIRAFVRRKRGTP